MSLRDKHQRLALLLGDMKPDSERVARMVQPLRLDRDQIRRIVHEFEETTKKKYTPAAQWIDESDVLHDADVEGSELPALLPWKSA
jgi:hypothetical protein